MITMAESLHFCSAFFSQWFNVLNRVHRATDEELKGMREESANVKHAVVRCWQMLSKLGQLLAS